MRRFAVLLAVLAAVCSQAYAQQQPFRGAISGFSLRAVYPTGWLGYPYSLVVGGETKFRWNEKGDLECGTITSNGVVLTSGSTSLLGMSDWPVGLTLAELGYLANVTSDIQSQLGGKAAASHSHAQSDVTGLVSALAGKSDTDHAHEYLPLSGGALTGPVTTNSTIDNVDVSAHDHSSATGQTRLALKDRASVLTWAIHGPESGIMTPLPLPAYFCGDGSNIPGTATTSGYLFPSSVEVRYLLVTARCEAPGGGSDPTLVLTLKRNADTVATVTLTGDAIDSGWFRATGVYSGAAVIAYSTAQGLSMTLAEGVGGGLWSTATVVLYYTTD